MASLLAFAERAVFLDDMYPLLLLVGTSAAGGSLSWLLYSRGLLSPSGAAFALSVFAGKLALLVCGAASGAVPSTVVMLLPILNLALFQPSPRLTTRQAASHAAAIAVAAAVAAPDLPTRVLLALFPQPPSLTLTVAAWAFTVGVGCLPLAFRYLMHVVAVRRAVIAAIATSLALAAARPVTDPTDVVMSAARFAASVLGNGRDSGSMTAWVPWACAAAAVLIGIRGLPTRTATWVLILLVATPVATVAFVARAMPAALGRGAAIPMLYIAASVTFALLVLSLLKTSAAAARASAALYGMLLLSLVAVHLAQQRAFAEKDSETAARLFSALVTFAMCATLTIAVVLKARGGGHAEKDTASADPAAGRLRKSPFAAMDAKRRHHIPILSAFPTSSTPLAPSLRALGNAATLSSVALALLSASLADRLDAAAAIVIAPLLLLLQRDAMLMSWYTEEGRLGPVAAAAFAMQAGFAIAAIVGLGAIGRVSEAALLALVAPAAFVIIAYEVRGQKAGVRHASIVLPLLLPVILLTGVAATRMIAVETLMLTVAEMVYARVQRKQELQLL